MITLRPAAAVLLFTVSAAPALAEVRFAIGEPADFSIKSGIGQVSGWAVSDREIMSVEAFIDGDSLGHVPYGGSRMDVAAAFPEYPDADRSGWSMKWNYALHQPGEHLLTVVITEDDGSRASRDVVFYTTRFHSPFIRDPGAVRTAGVLVTSPDDGRLVIAGAEIDGEIVDMELEWDRASQQFQIAKVTYFEPEPGPEPEPDPEPNRPPTSEAGPDLSVVPGESVSITGSGADPDGIIVGWSWTQLAGTAVTLAGSATRQVRFTAPASAGEIRLRLTVMDDDGATDSDDVVVTVEASVEPGNTTGQTLQSMLDDINDARAQAQDCGGTEFPPQPPLQWSSSLASIALQHAMDMAVHGYFEHTSMDGTSMGDRVFPYWGGTTVGENLAASSANRSDRYVVDLWLDSPGHCELLMSPSWTHAGIGKAYDPDNGYRYQYFWTLDFGG